MCIVVTLRLSPDFFYKCEHDYPKAVSFIRQYIPLGWPAPEETPSPAPEPQPEEEGPITITIREEELQKELVDLIHAVEQESKKEEIDIPRIMKVIAAARAMLEEEKERIRKDICEIDRNEYKEQKGEENGEKKENGENGDVMVVVVDDGKKEEKVEEIEEEEEEWHVFDEPNEVKKGEWGSEEDDDEDEDGDDGKGEGGLAAKPVVEIKEVIEEPIVEIVEVEKPVVVEEKPVVVEEKPIVEVEKPEEEEWVVFKFEDPKPGEWGSEETEEVETVETEEVVPKSEEKVEEEKPITIVETVETEEVVPKSGETVEEEKPIEETQSEIESQPQIEETVETEVPESSPSLPNASNSIESAPTVDESEEEWHPFLFRRFAPPSETPISPPETPIPTTETPISSPETPIAAPVSTAPREAIDWDRVRALLAEARACLLSAARAEPSAQQAVLRQVETAVMSQVDSLAAQLNESLQSGLPEDLAKQIDSLEQQLRDSAVDESRRLYAMLKQQREDLSASMEQQLERVESALRSELGEKIDAEKDAEIRSMLAQQSREIAALRRQLVDYKDDLIYEREMLTKGRLLSAEIAQNEAWAARILQEMDRAQRRVDGERAQHEAQLRALHAKLQHLVEQLETQEALLSSLLKTQEYQRAIWELQEHIIAKASIRDDLDRLVRFLVAFS